MLVEPSQRLQLAGTVDSGEPAVVVQWSSDDVDVDDTTIFSTPSNTQYLVVKAGQLTPGRQYFFKFTAEDSLGRSDAANITIRGNEPPVNGTLRATPRRGHALGTRFELTTLGWKDPEDNVPFNYRFAFISGDGASVTIGSGVSTVLNNTLLPLGSNLTLQVVVTDTYGAAGASYDGVAVVLGTDNVAGAVKNTTASIGSLVASGDSTTATALIASCSDMLNVASSGRRRLNAASSDEDDAASTSARASLLALLVATNSRTDTEPSPDTITLQAVTLGLTVRVPAQVDEATQASAVDYASGVVASTGSISETARSSIVGSLSSVVQAGFLRADSRRRRPTNNASAVSKITTVLQDVHLLALQDLVPGEEPIATRSHALSLSSSKVSCSQGTCMNAQASAPALLDDVDDAVNGAASFELSGDTLSELISGSVNCAVDGSAELGMMATTWGTNPYSADDEVDATAESEARFAKVGNVTSLSLTACGNLVAVKNLSSPITISLPVTSRVELPTLTNTSKFLQGSCEAEGQLTAFCNANSTVNVTCPAAGANWNVTCPADVAYPACRFFDEQNDRWDTEGCTAMNFSSVESLESIHCYCTCAAVALCVAVASTIHREVTTYAHACVNGGLLGTHLTSFTGAIGLKFGKARSIVTTPPTKEGILASMAVLCILLAMFGTSCYVFVHDRRFIAAKREQRVAEIWDSEKFQRSIILLHAELSEKGQVIALSQSACLQTSQERERERVRVLEAQHENAKNQLNVLIAPSWELSIADFKQALKHEHVIFILLAPGHASLERAPVVLLRTISLLRKKSL